MYNLYNGNGQWVRRVEEKETVAPPAPAVTANSTSGAGGVKDFLPAEIRRLYDELQKKIMGELETEDMIILLILYLMYKESGDTQLLLVMGGMLLL